MITEAFDSRKVAFSGAMEIVQDKLQHTRDQDRTHNPVCYLPGNTGRIQCVENWIFDNAVNYAGVYCFQTLALGPAEGWERAVEGRVIPVTPFIGSGLRNLVNTGMARNIRCNLSEVSKLYQGRWRPDVAFAHVSEPNPHGLVTLGLNAGIDIAAVKAAKYKVAMINSSMPRWHIGKYLDQKTGKMEQTGCAMSLDEFDLIVHIDEELMEHEIGPEQSQKEDANTIASNILKNMEDLLQKNPRDLPHTIQLGIGMIPNAFAQLLAKHNKSVAGVWSDMFSGGALTLYNKGLIRNVDGPNLRDKIVVGFVLGKKDLYWAMHDNPHFAVLPQEVVNDPQMIRKNDYMTSINTTLSISLTGEVAAATIGKKSHSDVGGQFDFSYGASLSKGGTAFIALASTTALKKGGVESKIVAVHPEGSHHTITADLPVVVATEIGVADLRELSDRDRVARMLRVANSAWRQHLGKQARKIPSIQGIEVLSPRLVSLKDGRRATVRPATNADIPAIKAYIEKLSDRDRLTRYMGGISVEFLTDSARLSDLYEKTLDYLEHAAFLMESRGEIIGISHAFKSGEGVYETSFSRRSDLQGLGIGSHLMDFLEDWGLSAEVVELNAMTYRTQNPRMRSLFDKRGFKARTDPEDPSCVLYSTDYESIALRRA